MKSSFLWIAGLMFAATAGQTQAGMIIVSTSINPLQAGVDNQGWVMESSGNSNPRNDSYVTNVASPFSPGARRSYFFFDLSSVTETITSATLRLRRYTTSANAQIEFFDTSTSATDLIATRGTATGSPAIFDDLGTGVSYGAFTVGTGSYNDILTFRLNSAAVADANSATGYFAIGGKALSLSLFAGSTGEPGNSGANYTQELVLETAPEPVPEPAAIAMWGLGALGIMFARRKHPQKKLAA